MEYFGEVYAETSPNPYKITGCKLNKNLMK
jgi:hypothetical protein